MSWSIVSTPWRPSSMVVTNVPCVTGHVPMMTEPAPGLEGRKAAEVRIEAILKDLDEPHRALLYRVMTKEGWCASRVQSVLQRVRWWLGW